MNRMRRLGVAVAAVIGLAAAIPTTQASAAVDPQDVGAMECGYHTVWMIIDPAGSHILQARYTHCTNEPYAVQITVNRSNGDPDEYRCVQPNQTVTFGDTRYYPWAYYNGTLC